MKRGLLTGLIIFFFYSVVQAIPTTWIGASGGNWSASGNWSAGVPASGDDAIVNSTVTIIIDVSPISANSITITNNAVATFDCADTRTIRVLSTSILTPGLRVNTGSTLIIDATNGSGTNNTRLDLTQAAGVTCQIDGVLIFSASGGSANSNTLLDSWTSPVAYGIVTVSATGIIRYLPNTGNTNAGTVPVFSIVMQAGSQYELLKNGGSFPVGNWSPASIARSASPGNNGPSFIGSSYGNLEINCVSLTLPISLNQNILFNDVNLINTGADVFRVKTGTGAVTYTMSINGNLTVSVNSILETSGNTTTSNSPGIIDVKGNIVNNGIIRENSAVTGNQFQLTGMTNQNISGSGSWTGDDFTFVMNGTGGATLLTPLILPDKLQLTNGKIITTSVNILTMKDNTTVTGGSAISFVEGPMKKTGNDNFIFPVGKGSIYAPIGIVNRGGETVTDEFTAEYKRTNPQSIHGNVTLPGNDHVSFVEYWTLTHGVGAATKKVSLAVNTTSFCKALANTYVSRWNGSVWTNEGSTNSGVILFPPFETGTITSIIDLSAFGDFTLITDLPFSVNPLPIDLIYFNAVKNNATATINWELSACCSKNAKFELQKSTEGSNFSSLLTVPGSETNKIYTANDNRLAKGINYYRLKMTDADGKVSYSKTIAVIHESKGLLITAVTPNPVHSTATITISSARQGRVNLIIYDIGGREVRKRHADINEGNTSIAIDMAGLPNGVYQVMASTSDTKTVFRFIRQ